MRRTFWPNRISQRFRAKNRSAGLKFTPIRENSRLSMKIVQNVLFRPCGGRFGQFAFFKVLDPKIALPDWNSRQYVKTVGFQWSLSKTCFSGHAEHVLAKSHFSTFQIQKSLCRFLWKLYQTYFSGHAEDVLAKSHFSTFQIQNRSAGLKFTPINENGRLSMKIVQNVLFRPCGGRFGQIAFFNVPDPKIALPLSMKTVPNVLFRPCGGRFDQIAFQSQKSLSGLKFTPIRESGSLCMKIVQNVLFRPCGGRFDQIAFINVPDPKIAQRTEIHANTWKQ